MWLICAGVAIVQLILGNAIVIYGELSYLIGTHAVLAVILLILSVYGYTRVNANVQKRILIGNIALVITTSVLGYLWTIFYSPLITLIHFFLALGVLSNFSVLYGLDRGSYQSPKA
ncbi:hypothetical protein D1868_07460 [Stygiolobus azoricus]|uniref:Heme A synthase n=1 Tax=Stygiolobus azoricus TaxID=41675 RepID=A0A650CST1_9CREN|nr:hypothetical protein D1868_07460 [Stygiolobus azoricus]